VVEFEFDLASDTAISVASEMVEEMSLSHVDAAIIAQVIALGHQANSKHPHFVD